MEAHEILDGLKSLIAAVDRDRDTIEQARTHMDNLTLRLALYQLGNGVIEIPKVSGERWQRVSHLVQCGQIRLCHDGSVVHGNQILTEETLTANNMLTVSGERQKGQTA